MDGPRAARRCGAAGPRGAAGTAWSQLTSQSASRRACVTRACRRRAAPAISPCVTENVPPKPQHVSRLAHLDDLRARRRRAARRGASPTPRLRRPWQASCTVTRASTRAPRSGAPELVDEVLRQLVRRAGDRAGPCRATARRGAACTSGGPSPRTIPTARRSRRRARTPRRSGGRGAPPPPAHRR